MHRVRLAVRENRLTSSVISEDSYVPEIESTGRGWVGEVDGKIVGFAVGNRTKGSIWALFIDPDYEGRGLGRRLHDTIIDWLWSQGLKQLSLTTDRGTRAQHFYEAAGWLCSEQSKDGELRFERTAPPPIA